MYRSHAGDMGPVSIVAAVSRCLALLPLLHWLARERNWIWTRRSVSWRVVDCIGSPFSREQWPGSALLMTSRRVAICGSREIRMVLDHTRTEREKCVTCWSDFPLPSVHRFESPRLSDMSNQLFVSVIT
jgi:hypothetical protein